MLERVSRRLLVAAVLCLAPLPALAQQPTPEQAAELLRSNPDLARQLQQRIGASGMTPDQIRARLRAEGYPESLLDAYLPGAAAGAEAPSDEVFSAVRSLGIADTADVQVLRAERDAARAGAGTGAVAGRDTLFDLRASRPPRPRLEDRRRDERIGVRPREPVDSTLLRPDEQLTPEMRATRNRVLADSGFTIFGSNIFRQASSAFDPNVGGPVDETYRLGPGDRLVLILTGDVEAAYRLDVTREGFVVIPQVGRVDVNGVTLAALDDVLHQRLRRVYSGVGRGPNATTRFSLSVARLRTNQVYVVGDVAEPGSYQISSAGTALSALYAARGVTANGSLRAVEVRRAGRTVSTLDVYDYLLNGEAQADVRLQHGDVVLVPVHGARVRVVGEVIRPATYEMLVGETLGDVLRAAGGLLPTASRQRVQVERILAPDARASGRERVILDVTGPAGQPAGDLAVAAFPLQAGDVVRVLPISARVANRLLVRGNVWNPGAVGFVEGMTVGDALQLAGGLRPDTYLGQVLVTRTQSDSSHVQLRATLRDTTGTVINDFALRPDDELRVFSVSEFRPERYVAVSGAVNRSGRYPYRDGMTMRDLVLLAGGLRESAYLGEAEVARLPSDRARGVTAQTFRVPLDSSYLFERGPDGRYAGPPGLPAAVGEAPDTPLRAYDNVLILQQPDWELQRTVVLTGEVRFPGRYAITNKNERVTDVIARAGGLTSEAYAEGVYFSRTRDSIGRIGIDLPGALRDRRHRDNLLLFDGDSLHVPVYNAVVYVSGAVNSPVAVSYVPGKDLSYYIGAAGGPTRNADVRRAFVTQPNGKVESAPSRVFAEVRSPRPRPGSRIIVPERAPGDRRDFLAVAGTLTQILASLVTVILVIANN
ncbi:MAG TPA: SLBB domain-containing protein [Gemmatimonadaceae bacterium]|nr:SLBB domain-containing protein [Gemmatimonadaceae bacterium]